MMCATLNYHHCIIFWYILQFSFHIHLLYRTQTCFLNYYWTPVSARSPKTSHLPTMSVQTGTVSSVTNVRLKHTLYRLTACQRALQTWSNTQYMTDKIECISCIQSCHMLLVMQIYCQVTGLPQKHSKVSGYNSVHYILTHFMIF